jgi:hypothetical protein
MKIKIKRARRNPTKKKALSLARSARRAGQRARVLPVSKKRKIFSVYSAPGVRIRKANPKTLLMENEPMARRRKRSRRRNPLLVGNPRRSRRSRRHNPGAGFLTPVLSGNPRRRFGSKRRRRNPGLGGIMKKETIIHSVKLGAGALIGVLGAKKISAMLPIQNPMIKSLAEIVIAILAGRFIPDRAIADGALAGITAGAIRSIAEARGITIFSGESLDDADIAALREALPTVRGEDGDYSELDGVSLDGVSLDGISFEGDDQEDVSDAMSAVLGVESDVEMI